MKYESGQAYSLITYNGFTPKIHPSAFILEGVRVIGDVEIGSYSSVWYNSVIRGDVNFIRIGNRTNIQDLSMLHVTHTCCPLTIGDNVTVGHSVSIHGATIKNNILIGIGANVLDKAIINSNSLIAAGTLIKERFEVPEGVLVAGVPGKIIRDLSIEEIENITENANNYVKYLTSYRSHLIY
ncbi:MAG: gamma carbonic anhydrase family protein [Ignavibacteria bacterium GWF2_33_9]|nr:MAG: gamma carbonic anhydrase family protein [Ignavibacteria bacterium GWF2_33_9]